MKRFILFLFMALTLSATANRPRVGLVLGGGGAKGAAEVGVLKVIEKAGIPIDCIVGTSIGSIVGGLYAVGYTAAELDTLFCTQEWLTLLTDRRADLGGDPYEVRDGITYIFGFPVMGDLKGGDIGGFGLMRGEKVEQMIDSMARRKGCQELTELKIPFRCVAADFPSATEVIIRNGPLSKAVRASMAIPGVFKPVLRDGKILVDGGMLNNLPVDVARQMGADIVIAVDLQQNDVVPDTGQRDLGMLAAIGDLMGIGGLVNWLSTRPDKAKYAENARQANIYIHPPLPDMDASSFGNKNCRRMINAGEQEAMMHWDELARLKATLQKETAERVK